MAEQMNQTAMLLARLSAEEASGEGGSSGGGATPVASGGNIFEIDNTLASGPGADTVTGGLEFLNWSGISSKDFKSLLEESSPMLNAIFFKINISAGATLPVIDYFANARKIQSVNFLAAKPVSLFGMSGGGH